MSLLLLLSPRVTHAASLVVGWDPGDSNASGYRIYVAESGSSAFNHIDVGTATSGTVPDLVSGKSYNITVVALGSNGLESGPSNQLSYTVPDSSGGTTGSIGTTSPTPVSGSTGSSGDLVNPSFESGKTGWNSTGNHEVVPSSKAVDGSNLVIFNNGQTTPNAVIAQSFVTVPGSTYTLTFALGVVAYNLNEQRLLVTVQGNSSLLLQTMSVAGLGNGQTRWVPASYQFTADSSVSSVIFKDVSPTSMNLDMLLDDVRVTLTSGGSTSVSTEGSTTVTSSPTPSSPSAPAFANGSFESQFSGWTSSGNLDIGGTWQNYKATDGVQFIVFNNGDTPPNAVLSQTFATVPGRSYTLTFDLGVFSYNSNEQRLEVTVQGGTSLLSRTLSMAPPTQGVSVWSPQTFSFVADSSATTLKFRDVSPATASIDMLLDNVRVY